MARKKKQDKFDLVPDEEFVEFDEDEIEELKEEESSYLDIEDEVEDREDYDNLDDTPVNPMGLAHQISKESETVKHFKELPREVKYSFLDGEEKRDVKHFARTYRNHQYIEKIIDLRVKEDERLRHARKKVVDIKNRDDLMKYFKACNRDYLLNDIIDLKDSEVDLLIAHVSTLKHNYLLDTIENNKDEIKELYNQYQQENNVPKYIDDMGNIGKVVDTSISSMGYKGNASQHSVMTINAVKNEDIQKVAAEKSSFSFMDAIKSKFG